MPPGILRHVLVRTTDDEREASVMLVVTANHKSLRAPVRALLDSDDRPDGFFVNINDRPGPYMVGRETLRIDGRSHVREDMLGTSFLISPTAFFQTNVRAARLLLQAGPGRGRRRPARCSISTAAAACSRVPLAQRGAWVVAVEENRQAVRDAEANLRLNKVPPSRVRLVAERAEDAMHRLQQEMFEVVVLDPPRQGCPDAVLDGVCRLEPGRIVYVSCNPERLAVERARLERGGYRLSRLQGVDMFPHTDHIEAVAVFEPACGPHMAQTTPADSVPHPRSSCCVPAPPRRSRCFSSAATTASPSWPAPTCFPAGAWTRRMPAAAETRRFWASRRDSPISRTADEVALSRRGRARVDGRGQCASSAVWTTSCPSRTG